MSELVYIGALAIDLDVVPVDDLAKQKIRALSAWYWRLVGAQPELKKIAADFAEEATRIERNSTALRPKTVTYVKHLKQKAEALRAALLLSPLDAKEV